MNYLLIGQIAITLSLTTLILLQQGGGTLGSLFGGGGGGGDYVKRRGMEKILFNVTIGLAVAFIIISLLNAYFG